MVEKKEIDDNSIPIGKEVTIFRSLLNCTQQDFANLLLLNRVTISKLEQANQVTTDIAFRLYYATQKIIENQNREEYIKYHAKKLQYRIDKILQDRMAP